MTKVPFAHQRHKPPTLLAQPRSLIVACPQLRSGVNLSRIVRTAGSFGISRVIVCGKLRVDPEIARQAIDHVQLDVHRSLPPVLCRLRQQEYELVGLEQTTESESLFGFSFQRRTVLVIGHERHGLSDEVLRLLDRVAEIPVYGLPHSYNVATAAALAIYEYCRQFPAG